MADVWHPDKLFSNVILPFLGKLDSIAINEYLNIISKIDTRIKKSYDNRIQGGYIDITNETDDNEIEFIYNEIYDKVGGNKQVVYNWHELLKLTGDYIDVNNVRPAQDKLLNLCKLEDKPITGKDKNNYLNNPNYFDLGGWFNDQLEYYRKGGMIAAKRDEFGIFVEKYADKLLNDFEKFQTKLKLASDYIDEHKKRPNSKTCPGFGKYLEGMLSEFRNKKEAVWNDLERRKLFEEFVNKYQDYLLTASEIFTNTLDCAQDYIDTTNSKPGNAFSKWGSYKKYKPRYNNKESGFKNIKQRKEYEAFMINNKKYYPNFEIVPLD